MVSQKDGIVTGRFLIVVHAIDGPATGYPDASMSPGFFEWPLDWVDEFVVGPIFTQF